MAVRTGVRSTTGREATISVAVSGRVVPWMAAVIATGRALRRPWSGGGRVRVGRLRGEQEGRRWSRCARVHGARNGRMPR